MVTVDHYKSCTDDSKKEVLKTAIFSEAFKNSLIVKNIKDKTIFIKGEISEKEVELKELKAKLDSKEEYLLEVVNEFGKVTKSDKVLALKDVVLSTRRSLVLETDPGFNNDSFCTYETTVVCETPEEKKALDEFLKTSGLTVKTDNVKVNSVTLKRFLKKVQKYRMDGARLLESFSLLYKF